MTSSLPQDPYIDAIATGLADVGFDIADGWTSDAETRGTYCFLSAVLTLDADTSGLDEDDWPEGLLLIWEWHTGIEAADGEPERGPSWQWAKKNADGSNTPPEQLPVDGFANPVQVAAAVHELATTGNALKKRPGRWDGTAAVETAISAWEAEA
ncbi:hypothetical protein N4G70_29235 [Streptomyces sp. ASQP_92]|uniref:hypothetical protein n=1 Tax=Streptomyces sp. ASQP_92 TaxID=2979116 RepID=UPI0021BE28AB|nr:hypothetical protein [Streptomyces sp. ASQP_92]MCT9092925.1 hypothetical protein [Streptomyces sp. ASQP_92]